MDFGMYGPEQSGGRLFDQDAQKAMLQAAQVGQMGSATRENNAQAAGREQDLAANQLMAQKMAAMGGGIGAQAGGSAADPIESMAKAAYESGAFSKGAEFATKAATVRAQEAAAKRSQTLSQKDALKGQLDTLEKASSLFEGVDSQETLDRANAHYSYLFGTTSPAAGLPYSPQVVDGLRNFGTTQIQRTKGLLDAQEAASKDEARKSAIEFRDFRKTILTNDAQIRQQREERLGKVGGKAIGTPSTTERKVAESLIAAEFPDFAERGEELRPAAFAVASRAKALQRANPALDADTAIRQAFSEEKDSGNFAQVDKAYNVLGIFPSTKKATAYVKPEPLPADRKLVVGKHYTTPHGVIKWDGKTGTLVKPTGNLSGLPAALPDGSADDGEEE